MQNHTIRQQHSECALPAAHSHIREPAKRNEVPSPASTQAHDGTGKRTATMHCQLLGHGAHEQWRLVDAGNRARFVGVNTAIWSR